jgi:hypothetical protein
MGGIPDVRRGRPVDHRLSRQRTKDKSEGGMRMKRYLLLSAVAIAVLALPGAASAS